ncbi:MAG: NAD(P)/FAD-dependent oxidoreductase, partial [Chloroflexi bacterium]|nr:NAD(P)/FAD-dependent oxidoreductase [Chloroflexota bacterium]
MSLSLDIDTSKDSTPIARYDVVVLGAGPYGLSATAHLRGQGLKVAVFGKPIYYWRANMPEGMLLRSFWWATCLSDPQKKYGFEQYFQEKGIKERLDPLPIETFIDYGLWFQKNAVPDVDETYIANIKREGERFVVTLEDGRVVQSQAVVMAPGLHYYAYTPPEYAHLPASLASHTSEHHDLSQFTGKKVAVIGRGQGALETAALVHEKGAEVHVITRKTLRWVRVSTSNWPQWMKELRAPRAGMGSGWRNLLLEKYPYTLHRLPQNIIDNEVDTTHGPAGSQWLKPRLFGKVNIHENTEVLKVQEVNGKAELTLSDGNVMQFDHVLLGTGYRPDVKRLPMLDKSLVSEIRTHRGSPVLNDGFETSVPGLYFVG